MPSTSATVSPASSQALRMASQARSVSLLSIPFASSVWPIPTIAAWLPGEKVIVRSARSDSSGGRGAHDLGRQHVDGPAVGVVIELLTLHEGVLERHDLDHRELDVAAIVEVDTHDVFRHGLLTTLVDPRPE